MKQMLQQKAALASGAAVSSSASAATSKPDPDEDPWPDVRLSATTIGLQDGRARAAELQRRGDFAGAVRMWAKLWYLARRGIAPTLPEASLAELARDRCEVLVLLEVWPEALDACQASLATAQLQPGDAALVLAWRARARAELSQVASRVQADMQEAQAKADASEPEARQAAEEELRALKAALPEIAARTAAHTASAQRAAAVKAAAERASVAAASAAARAAEDYQARERAPAASRPPGASSAAQAPSAGSQRGGPELGGDSVRRNQAYFSKLEAKFAASCANDGWDEIRAERDGSEEEEVAAPVSKPSDCIPADSDYFRVRLPEGAANRELRAIPGAAAPPPELKPSTRPQRNLDELRRVEAATREAVEAEMARQRGEASSSQPAAPERPAAAAFAPEPRKRRKPKVVDLNSIFDTEDEALESAEEEEEPLFLSPAPGGGAAPLDKGAALDRSRVAVDAMTGDSENILSDSEEEEDEDTRKQCENTLQAMQALQEFQRLGREKEERLSKWRDRWG